MKRKQTGTDTSNDKGTGKGGRIIVNLSIIVLVLLGFITLHFVRINLKAENPRFAENEELINNLTSMNVSIMTGSILTLIYLFTERKKKAASSIISSCAHCLQAVRLFSSRDEAKLSERFNNASSIDILATNSRYINTYGEEIEAAVKSDAKVRILILNPCSAFVLLRHKELGYDTPEQYSQSLASSLSDLKLTIDALNEGIVDSKKSEVKIYTHTPTFNMFIFDNDLYFNPIIPSLRGQRSTHIFYNLGNKHAQGLATAYKEEFDKTWSDADDADEVLNSYTPPINNADSGWLYYGLQKAPAEA